MKANSVAPHHHPDGTFNVQKKGQNLITVVKECPQTD